MLNIINSPKKVSMWLLAISMVLVQIVYSTDVIAADADHPLIIAARTGNVAMAKKSVRRGADVNVIEKNGQTPLHIATSYNRAEMVAYLLATHADVNKHNDGRNSPLLTAVSKGFAKVSLQLIEAGADMTLTSGNNGDPISILADWSNADLATILKRKNININTPNNIGDTVAHRQTSKLIKTLDSFSYKKRNPKFNSERELKKALDIYWAYFKAGANPNARNNAGLTPIIMLTKRGIGKNVNIIKTLLEMGADPNIRDLRGKTALDFALSAKKEKLIAVLTGHSSNPNSDPLILFKTVRNNTGADRLRLLLDAGVDPNVVAELCLINNKPKGECVKKGSGIAETRHILRYAIGSLFGKYKKADKENTEKNLNIIRILLEYGADPNDINDMSALWVAVRVSSARLVKLLLEFGAELEGIRPDTDRKKTPIYLPHMPYLMLGGNTRSYSTGRRKDKRGIIIALLESGDDPNESHPETGMTPLRIAAERGELGIVRALINAGADVNDMLDGVSILAAALKRRPTYLVQSVCSIPSDRCTNAKKFVKDFYVILKELVSAGAARSSVMNEEVRKLIIQGTLQARQTAKSKDYFKVTNKFKKVQELAPTWPDIYFKLAAVHEAQGDFPEALANYKIYLALAPNAANGRAVKDKTYELEMRAKTHVTYGDILSILPKLDDKKSGWKIKINSPHTYGKFKLERSVGMVLHRDDGVTNRKVKIPVKIQGRQIRWEAVYHMCGSVTEYGECAKRLRYDCFVKSVKKINCTLYIYDDWPRGFGSGGARSTEQFSWIKN